MWWEKITKYCLWNRNASQKIGMSLAIRNTWHNSTRCPRGSLVNSPLWLRDHIVKRWITGFISFSSTYTLQCYIPTKHLYIVRLTDISPALCYMKDLPKTRRTRCTWLFIKAVIINTSILSLYFLSILISTSWIIHLYFYTIFLLA